MEKVTLPSDIYLKLRTPTYESNFSILPRWVENSSDPYICTAQFKDSYLKEMERKMDNGEEIRYSRSMENMLPVFFVYESDNLSKGEQLSLGEFINSESSMAHDGIEREGYWGTRFRWIFSFTWSGGKSFHTLVWISPEFREEVAKDFKYYWQYVHKCLFSDLVDVENKSLASLAKISNSDSQCASIGRLSRNPNGIRENGEEQTCYFFNPNYEVEHIDLSIAIKQHNKVLEKNFIDKQLWLKLQSEKKSGELFDDDYARLEKMMSGGKSRSEAFTLAYDVLKNDICPKGGNYVSAAASLMACGFGDDIIRDMLSRASQVHPSNINSRSINNIIKRLRSKIVVK